ncbi:MAG: flagellar basal body-associated protein FliL [Candidatus Paceibacteria bacterium]|jgi:flagellar basal body-associated protein FliL
MAEEEVKEDGADGEAKGRKKKLFMVGGIVGVIGAGAIAAMMALPSKETKPRLVGPFSMQLFEDQFSCNLSGDARTRFLQMKPQAEYYAYDPGYMAARTTDQLYPASLRDTVFRVSSNKSRDEVFGVVGESTFAEELRAALDPVLFPVHIGPTRLPWDFDEESGLRPGLSSNKNTFRGQFEDHLLHVTSDPPEIWIDDGPKRAFEIGEFDVRVISPEGEVIFVDTSTLEEGFSGEVKVGTRGRIIRIIPVDLMVQ